MRLTPFEVQKKALSGQHYVTHKTGMARACKGSNSAWNTQEAKGCQKSWNRGFRNPKPQRLVRGLDKNRYILQQFPLLHQQQRPQVPLVLLIALLVEAAVVVAAVVTRVQECPLVYQKIKYRKNIHASTPACIVKFFQNKLTLFCR